MAKGRTWHIEEVRAAVRLYLVTPFGRIHSKNPDIITLAKRFDRTPSSIALKLSNTAALDESLPRKGMGHTTKLDRVVWAEFLHSPETVLNAVSPRPEDLRYDQGPAVSDNWHLREGVDRPTVGTARVRQSFFREMILTSYNTRCAVTGIEEPKLLNASHIVGWAQDPANRLNPQNGICLNALHDRAFDRHLITFDEDFKMIVSNELPEQARSKLGTGRLTLPERFLPKKAFLAAHRAQFFAVQSQKGR